MTSDAQLTQRVAAMLRMHPRTRGARVAVDVQNGVVLLGGTVESSTVRKLAGELARATEGTRDVCNMLSAAGPDDQGGSRTDCPVLAGPANELSADEVSHRFERTMALSFARSSFDPRPRLWAGVIAGASAAWWLLIIVIMTLGWIGAVVACVGAAVGLEALRVMRARRR